MSSMNKVFLMGNLTRDPALKELAGGQKVADFGLAMNESYRQQGGEMVERTCFVDVTVWGRQAETCSEYLSKGSPALVEGRLQNDRWETEQGEKRSRMKVVALRVQFLGRKGGGAPAAEPVVAGAGEKLPF